LRVGGEASGLSHDVCAMMLTRVARVGRGWAHLHSRVGALSGKGAREGGVSPPDLPPSVPAAEAIVRQLGARGTVKAGLALFAKREREAPLGDAEAVRVLKALGDLGVNWPRHTASSEPVRMLLVRVGRILRTSADPRLLAEAAAASAKLSLGSGQASEISRVGLMKGRANVLASLAAPSAESGKARGGEEGEGVVSGVLPSLETWSKLLGAYASLPRARLQGDADPIFKAAERALCIAPGGRLPAGTLEDLAGVLGACQMAGRVPRLADACIEEIARSLDAANREGVAAETAWDRRAVLADVLSLVAREYAGSAHLAALLKAVSECPIVSPRNEDAPFLGIHTWLEREREGGLPAGTVLVKMVESLARLSQPGAEMESELGRAEARAARRKQSEVLRAPYDWKRRRSCVPRFVVAAAAAFDPAVCVPPHRPLAVLGDQDLRSLLWTFAATRARPSTILADAGSALAARLASAKSFGGKWAGAQGRRRKGLGPPFAHQAASLCALARLRALSPEAIQGAQEIAHRHLQELANMDSSALNPLDELVLIQVLWAAAVADHYYLPLFQDALCGPFALAGGRTSVSVRMRLAQVRVAAEVELGLSLDDWGDFRQSSPSRRPPRKSTLHAAVERTVRGLFPGDVASDYDASSARIGAGFPEVDLAWPDLRRAIEVDGPSHFLIPLSFPQGAGSPGARPVGYSLPAAVEGDPILNGITAFKQRLLTRMGWTVARVAAEGLEGEAAWKEVRFRSETRDASWMRAPRASRGPIERAASALCANEPAVEPVNEVIP